MSLNQARNCPSTFAVIIFLLLSWRFEKVSPEKICNKHGFYCVSPTQVQFCEGNTNVPRGEILQCPPLTYCPGVCARSIPCMDNSTRLRNVSPRAEDEEINFDCPSNGKFPKPFSDCTEFYICIFVQATNKYVIAQSSCTAPSKFDVNTKQCSYAANVECPEDPTCNAFDFYCVTSTKAQDCTGGSKIPSGAITPCADGEVCDMNCFLKCFDSAAAKFCTPVIEPFKCTEEGKFPDPANCYRYLLCVKDGGSYRQLSYSCPEDYAYSSAIKRCDLIKSVDCGSRPTPPLQR